MNSIAHNSGISMDIGNIFKEGSNTLCSDCKRTIKGKGILYRKDVSGKRFEPVCKRHTFRQLLWRI